MRTPRGLRSLFLLLLVAAAGCVHGGRAGPRTASSPTPRNGGFEADRFHTPPGLAWDNGGISAWRFTGRVGLNPVYIGQGGKARAIRPILDNGRIPEGKQAAFFKTAATLRQSINNLPPGSRWVLTFFENAAAGARGMGRPRLAVLLNGHVLVPDHGVRAVDRKGVFRTPFRRIVSSPFTVPADGSVHLIFLCSGPPRAGLGLDGVRLLPRAARTPRATIFPSLGPVVLNGDFEADHFTRGPGYAKQNGGVTAWTGKGRVGVNPVWGDRFRRWAGRMPFADNGRIPSRGQVAFIQNIGELRQRISGFTPGARYRLVYYENGRVTRATADDPVLEVLFGGRVIVSPHAVPAVDRRNRHKIPFFRVESAVFPAPDSGAGDLVFRTRKDGGVTVLLDAVRIEKVRGSAPADPGKTEAPPPARPGRR